jgi:hypothetical protein
MVEMRRHSKPVEGDYVINNFTFKSGENLEQNYIIQP